MESGVIGFKRGGERVNVYFTGTVGTAIDHPRQGKTQLFRRNQSMADLDRIFRNPRVHTGAGYYRRHSAQRPEPSQRAAGGIMCCLANKQYQKQLLKDWDEDSSVTLALGQGYFVVTSDHGTWWWGIPRTLRNKVVGRQKSLPPVDYVALGPDDYYFVQFTDGNWWCCGPDSLLEQLQDYSDTASVELLAFAPDDGWYILWEDGAQAWQGIPRKLHNQLNGRQKSLPGVEYLAIGPNGEWFVRFLNGSWRSDGLDSECSSSIDELQSSGWEIISVAFGEDWSWAIRYGT